jgi:glycosyltransferase involved in cell wall biosynthesis
MNPLSILTVYNAYLNRGGEDEAFEAEAGLLEDRGHQVTRFRLEADEVKQTSLMGKAKLAASTVWSKRYHQRFIEMTRELQPDVVHFHNTFPLLSPSVYSACKSEGAAVVQTLHNYRLLCPSTVLYRDGHPCTDCVGKTFAWPGVLHGCYHDSPAQTAVIATMLGVHKLRQTWTKDVDLFMALTEYAKVRFIQGGLPTERIIVKPNFLDVDELPSQTPGEAFLFVGRLVVTKGVPTLLEAWRTLPNDLQLRIIGDGPMTDEVAAFAAEHPNVTYLGRQPRERVLEEMRAARALIFPSSWSDTFGMTIVEAYASGIPVIAANSGAIASDLARHEITGRLFTPDDPAALAEEVRWSAQNEREMSRMRTSARREYELKYTPEVNYRQLIGVYERAINLSSRQAMPFPDLTSHEVPGA